MINRLFYFHNGSLSQPFGNPIAVVSMFGYRAMSDLKSVTNELEESMESSQYTIQDKVAYSLLGAGFVVIQSLMSFAGI